MTVALKTLSPLTWQGTPSVISLPGLVDGQEHLKLPSGTQIDLFGQDLHPVKVFPLLGKEKEKTIADTCGRSSSILLESASLHQSLENKLQQLLDMGGLTIYKATLKQKVTPRQRVYSHLGLSARTTKGTGSSLLPSAWPTPSTRDHKGGYKGGRIRNGKLSTDTLDVAAQLTAWPKQTSGLKPQSYTAKTVSTGPFQLNPRFSLYLMGYPIEWAYCAEQVTPSSHRQQQK